MNQTKIFKILLALFAVVLCFGPVGLAGPVGTAFTYQGRLIDNNQPADGLYDLQFKLFDASSDGNQLWGDVNTPEVDVIDGYFTAELDFGSVFDANNRWLEIGVRPGIQSDPNAYTALTPRQKITATPYALYALNGEGGGADSDWIISGNNMYSGVSGNVGIGKTSPAAKLDVNGDIRAASVYKIGGNTVLSVPEAGNTFVGVYAGASNSGSYNTFMGYYAGVFNTTGSYNTFMGNFAGFYNTTGFDNTFSGYMAGYENTTGYWNTFSGFLTGSSNTTGYGNTFSGYGAGYSNTAGSQNTFSGFQAGNSNTEGSGNVFLGYRAGYSETGSNKLYIANSMSNPPLIYGDFSTGNVGIGTTSPTAKLEVAGQVKIADGSQGTGKVFTSDAGGQASWQSPTETDPTVLASVKDGVSWGEVSERPAGLDDGDDVGLTAETDPTVLASVKDGISWGEVSAIPAGFADGVDDVGDTDWIISGINMYSGVSGNVGIGEANPAARLVVGQGGDILLKAADEDAGDIIFATSTGTQKGRMWGDPTVGQNMLCLSSADNTADITIDPSGNVGIGTTSPVAKLEVAGQVKITDGSQGTGKVLISDSAGLASWQTPTGGGVLSWQEITGMSQQAVSNIGYIANSAGLVTITLPASPAVGDIIRVSGAGAGGWKVGQNDGQSIPISGIGLTNPIWTARASNQNWNCVGSSSDGTKLVAGVWGGWLYNSTDSGENWTAHNSSNWAAVASSADGTKWVAAASAGWLYTSVNSGSSWTARESSRLWSGVASSSDGIKLVAVVSNGQIYTSTDSGVNWTARESNRNWASVASSADGTKLVALANNGQIYTSTDSGVNWTARESSRLWYSVASSSDGTKLVAVVYNGQIYTSTNSGVNWTARESARSWYSVASSSDGSKLVAGVYGGNIYTSTDSGANWTARESVRNWRCVASSSDGRKLVAGVYGGQIYSSNFSTTSIGIVGYLTGEQFAAIEMLYIGSGLWIPLSHEGAIEAY